MTGENIRLLRQRLGWSMADLSRRLGCTVERIYAIEQNRESVTIDDLNQLASLNRHLNQYNEQIETEPHAEQALRLGGFEQIHKKDLKTFGKS